MKAFEMCDYGKQNFKCAQTGKIDDAAYGW